MSTATILQSDFLRFGDGTHDSIAGAGASGSTDALRQPFTRIDGQFTQLSYSSYPMSVALSIGGVQQEDCLRDSASTQTADFSGFLEDEDLGDGRRLGHGTISTSQTCAVSEPIFCWPAYVVLGFVGLYVLVTLSVVLRFYYGGHRKELWVPARPQTVDEVHDPILRNVQRSTCRDCWRRLFNIIERYRGET